MTNEYLSVIDEKSGILDACADYLWENPETAFTEFKSAAYLCDMLRQEGFEVTEKVAGIDTAFSGRFGHGHPIVGVLGEYDALSGLSQESCCVTHSPRPGENCGQGCGHNLLGMGSLGAAIAIKKYIEDTGCEGTVIFYGTPGEEGGSGKGFMARDGVFDELDFALCWHPDAVTRVKTGLSLANDQVLFRFDGCASHAGGAPHLGRSALDAVELMNIGVQFLREHMEDDSRVHYAITDAGGFSPNVVQPHAEVLYLIRATTNAGVKDLYRRVCDIAKGAALMTETAESHDFIKACSNTVTNSVLIHVMDARMKEIPVPVPTKEDLAFASSLVRESLAGLPDANPDVPYNYALQAMPPEKQGHGSTDVGDVSWVCPTVQVAAATWVSGTPGHSWQATAQGKTRYAKEMARYAAKVMAATAVEVFRHPQLLKDAIAEHRRKVGPAGYEPPIPQGVRPRPVNKL